MTFHPMLGTLRFWLFVISLLILCVLLFTTEGWLGTSYGTFATLRICSTTVEQRHVKYVSFTEAESENIMKLVQHVVKAHRYSRSGKTIYELNEAFKIAQKFLQESNDWKKLESLGLPVEGPANISELISPKNETEPEVCPEIYMGMKFGYPYYYTGYKTDYDNCTGQPLGSVVSVLLNIANDIPLSELEFVLKGFQTYYSNITVFVGYKPDQDVSQFEKYKNSVFVKVDSTDVSGAVWKKLANYAQTKYIFVGKQIIRFDNHSSIERMLRLVSYKIGHAVGTSHRYIDGRWFRGCQAMAVRNYTIRFVDGYDLSYNSCIYCGYLTGPFVIQRQLFVDTVDKNLDLGTEFVDMFARFSEQSKNVLSCPDVMVTITDKELQSYAKNDWLSFVQKREINRLIFTSGRDIEFTCAESKMSCPWKGGLIMPVCCIRELVDMMKFIHKTFSANNISLELEGGSNVGAAKMQGTIPYERDADFDWPVTDHEKVKALTSEFSKHGYQLIEDKNDYKCVGDMSQVNCGYFGVKNSHWRIEMWGGNYLGSDEAFRVGFVNRTQIMIDGVWMVAQHSPAAAARNEYGDDLYEHIEHWITLGYNTGWVQPKSGRWLACPKPGFHGCLDMFLPVGDIQFKDVWV